jgi:hypothetical protein
MSVITGRTRLQLETAIGYNLQAIFAGSWTSNASATVNTDTKIKSPADGSNGKWLHATSGGEAGEIVRVTDDSGAGALTHDALTGTPSSAETYILWDERYRPDAIYDFINQAIMSLNGRAYNPDENITLFADGDQTRFDIPSGFSMIKRLEYRSSFTGKVIDSADSAWTGGTNVTVATDDKLKKRGKSNKLTIGSVSTGAVIAYNAITSINISDYTHIEWWARASFTTTAADYKLLLDDTAGSGSAIELLEFPALTADTWTFCRVALAKADEDKAIISVGIEDDVGDNDNQTLWIDDIRAVHNDEAIWTPVPRRLWHIDKNARDLVLTSAGRSLIGYAMLKIVGGDEPVLLTADGNTNEVSDEYVIAKATSLALESLGPDDNKTARAISRWNRATDRAYRRLPFLSNVREVE